VEKIAGLYGYNDATVAAQAVDKAANPILRKIARLKNILDNAMSTIDKTIRRLLGARSSIRVVCISGFLSFVCCICCESGLIQSGLSRTYFLFNINTNH